LFADLPLTNDQLPITNDQLPITKNKVSILLPARLGVNPVREGNSKKPFSSGEKVSNGVKAAFSRHGSGNDDNEKWR
jgi:hypothetical protein